MKFHLLVVSIFSFAEAQEHVALRFNQSSCYSLEPHYQYISYKNLGYGPKTDDYENKVVLKQPKRAKSSSKLFSLEHSLTQYYQKREYPINILSTSNDGIEAFMVQVRGYNDKNDNITFVGEWKDIPDIGIIMQCGNNKLAVVVDKGRPIRMSNLSLTWVAPSKNVGDVTIVASIVYDKDAYYEIQSNPIPFQEPSITTAECGKDLSCYRVCKSQVRCNVDDALYMVTMEKINSNEVRIKLGGHLISEDDYTALGFSLGKDGRHMDMITCTKKGKKCLIKVIICLSKLS